MRWRGLILKNARENTKLDGVLLLTAQQLAFGLFLGKHPKPLTWHGLSCLREVGLIDLLIFSVGAAHGRDKLRAMG